METSAQKIREYIRELIGNLSTEELITNTELVSIYKELESLIGATPV